MKVFIDYSLFSVSAQEKQRANNVAIPETTGWKQSRQLKQISQVRDYSKSRITQRLGAIPIGGKYPTRPNTAVSQTVNAKWSVFHEGKVFKTICCVKVVIYYIFLKRCGIILWPSITRLRTLNRRITLTLLLEFWDCNHDFRIAQPAGHN